MDSTVFFLLIFTLYFSNDISKNRENPIRSKMILSFLVSSMLTVIYCIISDNIRYFSIPILYFIVYSFVLYDHYFKGK